MDNKTSSICRLYKKYVRYKDKLVENERWKRYTIQNSNQKIMSVVILISDTIVFKTKIVPRDKEGSFVMTNCQSMKKA